MRFKEGATAFAWNGEKIGHIERIVLDPKTREVTHVVIEKGFLFTTDKVVPISLISAASEDRVTLRKDAGDLEALPEFERTYYVPLNQSDRQETAPAGYVRPYYWYPPSTLTGWVGTGYGFPIPPYVVRTARNTPAGTVPLDEGTQVMSADGEHVGDVEAVLTGPEQDRATHLLISSGLLLKEKKLVPTTWISRVTQEEIELAVGSPLLEQLPAYEA